MSKFRIDAQPMVPLAPTDAAQLFYSGSVMCYVANPMSPFVCGQWMGRRSMITELPFADAVAYFTANVAMIYDPNVTPPPVNVVPPAVSGNWTVGWRLSCTTGVWSNSPNSFTYQWLRNGQAVAGAIGAAYILKDPDAGATVGCSVIPKNAQGPGLPALSNTGLVSQGPPVNFNPPIASLNPGYLLCTGGMWTGGEMVYNYQWFAGGAQIGGATNSTWQYAGYEGQVGFCAVTVKNAYGSCDPVNSNSVLIPG